MHKPLVITKELNSSSLEITQEEKNLAITCASKPEAPSVDKAATATYDLKAAKK